MPKPTSSSTPARKTSPRASSRPAKQSSPPDSSGKNGYTTDGRRARGDHTRARIIDAALQIASIHGLDGVTIGPVAAAADVSKGHLALLVGSREQLQLATLEAAVALFRERVIFRAEAAATPAATLRQICLGWFDYVRDRVLPGGCLVTAVTSEFRSINGPVRDRVIELRTLERAFLRDLIARARSETKLRALSPAQLDRTLFHLFAYRAAANVAFALDATDDFALAQKSTRELLSELLS